MICCTVDDVDDGLMLLPSATVKRLHSELGRLDDQFAEV